MFHCLDFWKNEFAAKQDQKPVSGKTEFFGEKGSVNYWGSRIMEREFMDDSPVSRSMIC
ncbi:MAG: hypothetical protein NZ878_12630 [SAR324 cluster bacterium]|nr:hypothetical protein [SAR324 cluster bacterium]